MADEMVTGAGAIGQFQSFGLEFLDVVLTEIAQPECVGLADRPGRELLGHRYQLDSGTLAAGTRRRRLDAGFYLVYLLFEQLSIIRLAVKCLAMKRLAVK